MRLSVLDQSPVISGHSARDALAATLELAQAAEELGYERFWLAEHHGLMSLADPCPEILLARILPFHPFRIAYVVVVGAATVLVAVLVSWGTRGRTYVEGPAPPAWLDER